MKTPERMSPQELRDAMISYLIESTTFDEDQIVCTRCQSPIAIIPAYISLHTTGFETCAGPGAVERVPIPYCARCEPRPSDYGCVHIDYFTLRSALTSGRSLTGDIAKLFPTHSVRPPPATE